MTVTRSFHVTADEKTERSPNHWRALFQLVFGASYAAQVGHWNTVDKQFNDIHAFFGAEYSIWAGYVDTVAEHIRQHPGNELLPATLPAVAEGLKQAEATSESNLNLISYSAFLSAISSLIEKADSDLKHPADVDLLGELARVVSKSKWKVDSMLERKA